MHREWVPGPSQQIDSPSEIDRIPEYDPRSGDHCWLVITSYRVDPEKFTSPDPTVMPILDHETLVSVTGPGCYYCEQLYSSRLAKRRCKGKP